MNDPAPKDPAESTIPILMEPVAGDDESPADSNAFQDARPLGREDQQSLFTDLPAPASTPRPAKRLPPPSQAQRLQAAKEMLRARAPALVEEVVAAHQKQLTGILRERLRRELSALLDDLAGDDPPKMPPDDPR